MSTGVSGGSDSAGLVHFAPILPSAKDPCQHFEGRAPALSLEWQEQPLGVNRAAQERDPS